MKDLFGHDKVEEAIERIKMFEPPEGYYLAFSGGKDSQCIYHLAEMAGVKFDAHYNRAMEPPELVRFIKQNYPKVETHLPKRNMWQLIRKLGCLPTRGRRYCCSELKEIGGKGRRILTGVRAEESTARRTRKMTENCLRDGSESYVHPIIDWKENDVWEFIKSNGLKYCSLYEEGFFRLGVVLCPCAKPFEKEIHLKKWPKIVAAYRRAMERAWKEKPTLNSYFKSVDDLWNWWISSQPNLDNPDQMVMFE